MHRDMFSPLSYVYSKVIEELKVCITSKFSSRYVGGCHLAGTGVNVRMPLLIITGWSSTISIASLKEWLNALNVSFSFLYDLQQVDG